MPSVSTLVRAWGLMMVLTALSLWAAVADQGIAPVLAAMAAGVLKAVLILWVYLNLRRSPSGWKAIFTAFLAIITVIVVGAYLVGTIPTQHRRLTLGDDDGREWARDERSHQNSKCLS